MLEKLQPPHSPIEHLFIGTDQFIYFAVSWDAQLQQLHTEKTFLDQADKSFRDAYSQDRCLLDPTNRFMALQLFDGIVTIIPLGDQGKKKGSPYTVTLGDPTPARISDIYIRSSTFLYPRRAKDDRPKIAFLFEDNRQKTCLIIRRLDYTPGFNGEPAIAELDYITTSRDDLEQGANHLISVPGPACTYTKKQEGIKFRELISPSWSTDSF